MDERIRAAERSGDRQRLLVELYRAGKEISWQVGDRVVGAIAASSVFQVVNGKPATLINVYETGVTRAKFDEVQEIVWSSNPSTGSTFTQSFEDLVFGPTEIKPEGC